MTGRPAGTGVFMPRQRDDVPPLGEPGALATQTNPQQQQHVAAAKGTPRVGATLRRLPWREVACVHSRSSAPIPGMQAAGYGSSPTSSGMHHAAGSSCVVRVPPPPPPPPPRAAVAAGSGMLPAPLPQPQQSAGCHQHASMPLPFATSSSISHHTSWPAAPLPHTPPVAPAAGTAMMPPQQTASRSIPILRHDGGGMLPAAAGTLMADGGFFGSAGSLLCSGGSLAFSAPGVQISSSNCLAEDDLSLLTDDAPPPLLVATAGGAAAPDQTALQLLGAACSGGSVMPPQLQFAESAAGAPPLGSSPSLLQQLTAAQGGAASLAGCVSTLASPQAPLLASTGEVTTWIPVMQQPGGCGASLAALGSSANPITGALLCSGHLGSGADAPPSLAAVAASEKLQQLMAVGRIQQQLEQEVLRLLPLI